MEMVKQFGRDRLVTSLVQRHARLAGRFDKAIGRATSLLHTAQSPRPESVAAPHERSFEQRLACSGRVRYR